MKQSEILLPARTELKLCIPKDGFSDEFLRAMARVCSDFPNVYEAYLVLAGEEATLLLAFQIEESGVIAESVDDVVAKVMEGLMSLVDASIQVHAICLNGSPVIRDSILSLTGPFYTRK